MSRKIITTIIASLLVIIMCTGCVSSTRVYFQTDVEGAEIYVDGQKIGNSPIEMKLSNAVWEDPDIVIKADGYKDLHTTITREPKVQNIISGCLLFWPAFLYCYGPKQNQYFMLTPVTN